MTRLRSFLPAAIIIATGALAASQNATVRGTVDDSSGALVSSATVKLHQLAGAVTLNATSDANGRFVFDSVPRGEYLVDAAAPGLTIAHRETLQVVSGEQRQLTLHLIVAAVNTEVTVTSANEPQSVDQISKALDVVVASDAEQRGIFSVSDALRFVPGLRVSTLGGPGAFTDIQIRGLRTTDTAVLIDGFPFRDPTAVQDEATAYISDLFLVDTSRIEVLRGSGSSLYGSNAMSGVLNILTDSGGGPVHGDIDVQGGGLGLFHGTARLAGGALENRLTYSAGISLLDVTNGVADAGAVRDWSGQAGATYALTPNIRIGARFFGNTGYQQQTTDPEPTLTAPTVGVVPAVANVTFIPALGDPDSGRYAHFADALFRFEHQVNSRLSYRIAYGIVDSHRDYTDGPAGPVLPDWFQPAFNTSSLFDGGLDTLRARFDYLAGAHQILTAGYEFEKENYSTVASDQNPVLALRLYNRTTAAQRTNAAFAQDQLHFLGDRLQLLVSGRFTHPSLDQPQFVGGPSPYTAPLPSPPDAYTGDVSLAYTFYRTSTKIRAHAGNSYRLPALYERFGGYFYGGFYTPLGDPRLSPERAVSGDIGFDQYAFRQRLEISATYFYSELQRVIGYEGFPPGYIDPYGRISGYYNTTGGISRGVEVSGEYRPLRHTTVLASYTYTNAQDRTSEYYTGTNVDPLETPRILPTMVKIVATQQLGRFDLGMDFDGGSTYLFPLYGANFAATTAFRFDGPRQLGLSAGYTAPLNEKMSLRFYTRVWNVLNQDYFEEGFQTPARWAVAGLRFSF